MLIPRRLFEDAGFSEEVKMEEHRQDLRARYECCRAMREPGDDHPWCFEHAPANHATRCSLVLATRATAERACSGHGKLEWRGLTECCTV